MPSLSSNRSVENNREAPNEIASRTVFSPSFAIRGPQRPIGITSIFGGVYARWLRLLGFFVLFSRKHGKCGDDQQVGGEGRPAEDRHAHVGHAGCNNLQDRPDKVDSGQQGSHTGDLKRPNESLRRLAGDSVSPAVRDKNKKSGPVYWSTRAGDTTAHHCPVRQPFPGARRSLQRLIGDFVGEALFFSLVGSDGGVIHGIDPFVRRPRR